MTNNMLKLLHDIAVDGRQPQCDGGYCSHHAPVLAITHRSMEKDSVQPVAHSDGRCVGTEYSAVVIYFWSLSWMMTMLGL